MDFFLLQSDESKDTVFIFFKKLSQRKMVMSFIEWNLS